MLERALHNAGMLSEDNFGDLKKIGWSRASRTDKGVHAAANGISCKVNIRENVLEEGVRFDPDSLSKKAQGKNFISKEKMVTALNDALKQENWDKDVRVLSVRRVTKKFDIKLSTKSRTYEYMIPAKMFYPLTVEESLKKQVQEVMKDDGLSKEEKIEKSSALLEETLQGMVGQKGNDLVKNAEELLPKLQAMAKKFEGTHNYHNFTKNGKPDDKSMNRYILNMKVEYLKREDFDPSYRAVYPESQIDNEYFMFTLHGQSFIYHQIRKIIGSIVQVFQ